jgi:Calcineurin-like phosphoesterase
MVRTGCLLLILGLACSRTTPAPSRADSTTLLSPLAPPIPTLNPSITSTSSEVNPRPTLDSAPQKRSGSTADAASTEVPYRFPAVARVVAVGDLHGDLSSAREALKLAGALGSEDRWIGGEMVLVQVGDQLDRGDDEPEILQLLDRLSTEAKAAGGAVHVLNGNHEIMNAVGDLRYVTPDGFRDYAAVPLPSHAHLPPSFPAQARGRYAAFAPGSELARKLAERNTVAIVGETVFVHAGLLPQHVSYGIGRINDEVRRFLRGEIKALPDVVNGEDAPIWTRVFGEHDPAPETCTALQGVLETLAVKRLVVGHTVQQRGITSACEGRVYRIDVGLSDYYGDNRTQVLEIRPNAVTVLTGGAPPP